MSWKDAFLKEIVQVLEKEKSLELQVTGDFHDEEDMRTVLRLSEHLGKIEFDGKPALMSP